MTPSLASSNYLQDPKDMGAFSKCPTLGIENILGDHARNKVSRSQSHVAPAFCVHPHPHWSSDFPFYPYLGLWGHKAELTKHRAKYMGAKQGNDCLSEDDRERTL